MAKARARARRRRYSSGEAWAWVENGESDILGDTEDTILYAPTHYKTWEGFINKVHDEAKRQGHTFSLDELNREVSDYWLSLYNEVRASFEKGHYGTPGTADHRKASADMRRLDRAYDAWSGAGGP